MSRSGRQLIPQPEHFILTAGRDRQTLTCRAEIPHACGCHCGPFSAPSKLHLLLCICTPSRSLLLHKGLWALRLEGGAQLLGSMRDLSDDWEL